MNTNAIPTLMISMGMSTWVAYEVCGVTRVSRSSPTDPAMRPGMSRGLGPTRGRSWDEAPAPRMIPRLNGRNAKPAFTGE